MESSIRTPERRRAIETTLADRRAEQTRVRRLERGVIAGALAFFGGGLVFVLACVDGFIPVSPWLAAAAYGVLLIAAIALRERITRRRRRLGYAISWMEQALARLDDQWTFGQEDGREHARGEHPFAMDLDIFGEGSLFERVNATRTPLGRDALAAILKQELVLGTTGECQEAVRELRDAWIWREHLEIELRELRGRGGQTAAEREEIDRRTRELVEFGDTPDPPPEGTVAVVARIVLALLAVGALAGVAFGLPWIVALAFYFVNFVVLGRASDIEKLLERFEGVTGTLEAWSAVIRSAEAAPREAPLLHRVHLRLSAGEAAASTAIRRLAGIVDRLAWRHNAFWRMTFDVLLLFDLHVRRSLYAWKRRHGRELRAWLEAAAWYEALASLATYSDACREDGEPFEDGAGPPFEAKDLAHPLIARAKRVGNDLSLRAEGEVLLVTGSNMSGKSTLLRAAGLAVVMARAGLPVAAGAFRFQHMDVVTCMRVQDSIGRGSSLFHAEVTRLRACVDYASRGVLTLVLLDEILAGTNSRERHAGTVAVLRGLALRPALTLVATHDLELARLEQEFPDRVEVVHFRDLVQDGRMMFDYRMRPGICPSTNALRVMRLAGLDVPEGAAS